MRAVTEATGSNRKSKGSSGVGNLELEGAEGGNEKQWGSNGKQRFR